jgi:hypothetical protein
VVERIQTYAEFWPYYLRAHSHPGSRALHYLGSICGLASLAAAVLVSPWFLLVGLVVGYGPAWIGQFVVEKNKPATFGHPFWSLISDYRMFGLALVSRLRPELNRAKAAPKPVASSRTRAERSRLPDFGSRPRFSRGADSGEICGLCLYASRRCECCRAASGDLRPPL